MGRYDWVTNEMFHRKLEEILDKTPTVELIAVPGVYMAVCEYFNNEVLDTLAAEHPWLSEGFQAGEDTDDRGDAFLFAYHEQTKVGAIDYGGIWGAVHRARCLVAWRGPGDCRDRRRR